MTRALLREAIATYLEDSEIEYLGVIQRQAPKLTAQGDIVADPAYSAFKPGVSMGAAVFMRLSESSMRRVAFGGPTNGRKFKTYKVEFDVLFRAQTALAEDAGDANDEFLDSFEAAILANRTAASSDIFQWGEGGDSGGTDIYVESFYPTLISTSGDSNVVQIVSKVTVTACEFLDT